MIRNAQGLSSLFRQLGRGRENNGRAGEALAKISERIDQLRSEGNPRLKEKITDALSRAKELREARRRGDKEKPKVDQEPEVIADSPAPEIQPAPQPEGIEELAKMFVEQFENGAGRELSDEEFSRRVTEVSDLYKSFSNGRDRLDSIVFANDSKTDVEA